MAGDGTRTIRPWAWLLGGVLAVPIGLLFALAGIAAVAEPDDISGLPTCRTDFGDDCLTERDALLADKTFKRRSGISREQRWIADVPEGGPGLEGDEKLRLDIPRQPGRDELAEGVRVRLVYYEDRAAVVRLPSGTELETDDHPRRYAPMHAFAGLFTLGGGAFATAAAWRAGRKHGFWHKAPARFRIGVGAALALAGMVGFMAQALFGSVRWIGFAGATAGFCLGVWAGIRARSRPSD
jgi:hypothetical protein